MFFDTTIALLAVNFTAIFSFLNLPRSAAGFADRDAFVLLLWLVMFLFYLKAESALPKTESSADITQPFPLIRGIKGVSVSSKWPELFLRSDIRNCCGVDRTFLGRGRAHDSYSFYLDRCARAARAFFSA